MDGGTAEKDLDRCLVSSDGGGGQRCLRLEAQLGRRRQSFARSRCRIFTICGSVAAPVREGSSYIVFGGSPASCKVKGPPLRTSAQHTAISTRMNSRVKKNENEIQIALAQLKGSD